LIVCKNRQVQSTGLSVRLWHPDLVSACTMSVIFLTAGRWFLYGKRQTLGLFFPAFFLNSLTLCRKKMTQCRFDTMYADLLSEKITDIVSFITDIKKMTLRRPTLCHIFSDIKSEHNVRPTKSHFLIPSPT
jgi:hypothetical protein